MLRKMLLPVSVMLGLFLMIAGPQRSFAANVMNYGADGMDYFQFTTPSMAFDKASVFTTLITFTMHVNADGTLLIGGVACTNGVYVGPTNWNSLITTLKTPPTTVTRYEVCIGGWTDTSFDNIKSLVTSQGTGPTSILYKNFQALKNAVPGIDAINDDDEKTYDLNSSTKFANMLGGLGCKFTMAPYMNQSFWVNLKNSISNCDYVYVQCYDGGAGNDPSQWQSAMGSGVTAIGGQESNTANPATFRSWYLEGNQDGGFYYPDIVFNSTYWSAAIIEADGSAPTAPTGVAATLEGNQVKLSWDVVPGAISYNIKRSTVSGGEATIATISTANTVWPDSNQYFDTAPSGGAAHYYEVSAVNTNGESPTSIEIRSWAPTPVAWFKADALTSLANGASVAIWPDSSGCGFTAIQTTFSQRPTYVTDALNGLPVVHFNGANNQVLAFNRPVQDDFTVFCVFRSTQGSGSGNQFYNGAGLVSGEVIGVTNDFGTCLSANGQVCVGVGNPDTSLNSMPGFNDGNPHLITMIRRENSGELDLYVDGNLIGRTFGSTNPLNAPSKLTLGAQQTLNNFFSGDIAEVKIYNAALSDADRLTQEASLARKWGVNDAVAGLLAYEGFDYPVGSSLNGQSGGMGWSNGWVDVSGNAGETVVSGLAAGDNAPAGFDSRSVGDAAQVSNDSRAGRWLDCSTNGCFALAGYLNSSGDIGASGKTLYLSFLQRPSSPAQFYEFEFHRGDLNDGGRIAGIGNDLANATTVNLRMPNSVQTPFALGNTNVNFYVVRIDYHGGNDDVYVYNNPTGLSESDNQPALTMLGVGDMSFNGISMGAYLNGVIVQNDEIRLGETWASVLGNPPTFIVQLASQTAYIGENVTFTALAQSSVPLNYQWYLGANVLAGQTNTSLTLSNVLLNDAGEYSVTASNALGVITSSVATLTMQTISVAISGPESIPVGPGSNLVVSVTVNGASPLALQWYKNGVAITGATNVTYAVGAASAFDAGQYLLVANNAYGSATSSIVNAFPSFGGLLAYEGFNYGQSSSDIGGGNGGFGWAGAWVNVNGNSSQSDSNSLAAGANAPVGYDTHSLNGYLFIPNSSRKGRYLDCSTTGTFAQHGYIDGNGNIGADGKTLYISFMQQPSSTSPFYEFELKRSDLGDDGRIGGIGNDVGSGNDDANLRIESPAGGSSTFYDLGTGDTGVDFYVLRIDYQTGNDTVTVYRNPTSATEPATPTLVVSNVTDMSFNGISFGAYLNSDTVAHDELRFGMAWADVVGNTVSELKLAQHTNITSSLLLAASPNYNYELQAATNVNGLWSNIGNVVASTLGSGQFADKNATSPQGFYRVMNGTVMLTPSSTDIIFDDFEQTIYGAWVTTGTAFGHGPAQGGFSYQNPVSGYMGSGLVDSYYNGDTSTGTLTSPPFVITKPYLDFLIGGGDYPGQECMSLILSNVVVATATGADSETLTPQQWNVSAYLGQTVTLQIVDSATGSWGHILIDEIVFSDTAFPALSETMLLTNDLLNLPVKNGATMKRVTVTASGQPVRDFNIELADGTPDWWAFVDVSEFSNQLATILVSSLAPGSAGLSSIVQTNGIVGATNLYTEALRPQLHFSTKRGWLNDANGMFYFNGQYNLYYQHDPFNWDGSGQKWWGHAVSQDMVNWQELREGIYSHTYGDDVWSGSAVVDINNTGGFKTGTNDVIVAAYYSTARGQCIDYSTNGGLSFLDYPNNPVVTVSGRDPHMFWYAPSNYWVMAVYDSNLGGIDFFSTPDFHIWTYRSGIAGFYECPDIFQLPVDGNTNNMMWELNDGSAGYMLGQFNGAVFTPTTTKLPGNSGSGFYASQTFTTMPVGDNRKVRIGWAQIPTPGMPFNQLMYFPTVLTLQTTANGVRLCSTPIAEITNNAVNVYTWTNLNLSSGSNPLSGIRGSLFDVKARFAAGAAQTITFSFQNLTVTYNVSTQQISCNGDTQSLPPINGIVQLEIIVDIDTIEIFGNNGQLYMPLPADNASGNSLVSLTCTGGNANFNSLTINKLRSIWAGE
jgi:fructan beta-fructosidase